MNNIIIGSVTLRHNPEEMTVIRSDKYCASKLTYTSVAFFSWGLSIVGKEILLRWSYMESDEFKDLDDLYIADSTIVFDPVDGLGKTYNVVMKELDSKYFYRLGVSPGQWRKDVNIVLLILSEVV